MPEPFVNSIAGVAGRPATLLKKGLWHRCFPVNFVKFLRTLFLIEHLRWLLLFIDGATPLHNCEFRKTKVLLLTKNFFSRSFQSCKFFHERVSCVKNGTYKGNSIELSTFLKYGLTKLKKAPSQLFTLVLNMPL